MQTLVVDRRRLARCSTRGIPALVERRRALRGPDLGAPGALEHWFSAAAWGLAIFDPGRRFLRVNPALAEMDGVSVDDHGGRHVSDVLPGLADQIEPILRRVFAGETIASEELVGRTRADPDHDHRWVTAWFPMLGPDGGVVAAAAMMLPRPAGAAKELAARVRDERMRLAVEGTGTGFWEWDPETDEMRWSETLATLHGLAPHEVPSTVAGLIEIVHPDDRELIRDGLRTTVAEGHEYYVEYRVGSADAGERWVGSRGRAIRREDGGVALVVGLAGEMTERRRRADALAFLAEAGHALAGSLDPVETLNEIARLAVPRLADWCAVQLASDSEGGFENIAVAHVDPDKVRWALELQERYPPDADAPTGVPEVIRTGRSELYPEIDEELLRAGATDAEHLEIIRQLRMTSAMVVPLRARERTLGAITFIFAESGRQYSTHELELAEELGRRAGLALDHARLYDREHKTAETLQRALLPPTMPHVAGHDLAARYLPGHASDHVGGDWYDAFELPDGRYGIAIGDIGGRGISAAALMGQVRNGLRAYALKTPGPGPAMADLRAMCDRLEEFVFATLSYIVYDAATGEGVLASAGHLPTLVIGADGSGRFLDAPRCPPLGADPDAPCTEHAFTLARGETMLLYTDGLVESRQRSIDTGLERLAAVAQRSRGDVQRLADDIVQALPDQRQDDIALLALRRSG
jgi:PAS domain S-box-containing protein